MIRGCILKALIARYKHNLVGVLGMLILQSNNVPLIIQSWNGQEVNIYTPIMCIAGLSCYLWYSVARKDMLYTISNSIGISFAVILLLINL